MSETAVTPLEDHLASAFPEPDTEEDRQRFVVDSAEKAAWAMRKMAKAAGRIAENRRIADDEHARIADWLASANAGWQHDADFFAAVLEGWWRGELARELEEVGGDWSLLRRKSRSFPAGTISARYSPPVPQYDDEEAAGAWLAATHPGLVQIVEKPRKNDVKAAIGTAFDVACGRLVDRTTGEPVPGISVAEINDVQEAVTVTVKAGG